MNFLRKWWARVVLSWNNICPIHLLREFDHGELWCCSACYDLLTEDMQRRHEIVRLRRDKRIERAKAVLRD
jgi:hypothetical protein